MSDLNLTSRQANALQVFNEVQGDGRSASKVYEEFHAGYAYSAEHEESERQNYLALYTEGEALYNQGYRLWTSKDRTTVPILVNGEYAYPAPENALFVRLVEAGHIATSQSYRTQAIVKD